MSDYGVSEALKNLSPDRVKKVVKYIETKLGLEDCEDLKLIEEHDLTQNNLLLPIPARKLIKYWKEEFAASSSNYSRVERSQQRTEGNSGKGSKKRKKKAIKKQPKKRRRTATPNSDETSSSNSSSEDEAVKVVQKMRDAKGAGALAGSNQTTNFGVINHN